MSAWGVAAVQTNIRYDFESLSLLLLTSSCPLDAFLNFARRPTPGARSDVLSTVDETSFAVSKLEAGSTGGRYLHPWISNCARSRLAVATAEPTMRLINTSTLDLEEFLGSDVPPYAILSHTWGSEEVTLQQWVEFRKTGDPATAAKAGCAKVLATCELAVQFGAEYVWVDTNCIDKTSSAELTEAINSMFAWYRQSLVCLVHLEDFEGDRLPGEVDTNIAALSGCRWFSRGWTLQELLAPRRDIHFFSRSWQPLGTAGKLRNELSRITGIHRKYISGASMPHLASISTRMSWAASRQTTRPEDMAYCLLGIFQINMALLYGEGDKAFRRLQEEIMKVSTDHTLFAWEWPEGWNPPPEWVSFLAPSPSCFRNSSNLYSIQKAHRLHPTDRMFSMTNYGLSISTHLHPLCRSRLAFAVLLCGPATGCDGLEPIRCAIPLVKSVDSGHSYTRLNFPSKPVELIADLSGPLKQLYIPRAALVPIIPELPILSGRKFPFGQGRVVAVVQLSDSLRCEAVGRTSTSKLGYSSRSGWLVAGIDWVRRDEAMFLLTVQDNERGTMPRPGQLTGANAMLLYVEVTWMSGNFELNMGLHSYPDEPGSVQEIVGNYPWGRWARPGLGTYDSSERFDRRLTHDRVALELRGTTELPNGALFSTLCVLDTKTDTPYQRLEMPVGGPFLVPALVEGE